MTVMAAAPAANTAKPAGQAPPGEIRHSTWSKCPVASWLADHEGGFLTRDAIIAGLGERLSAEGLPLCRVTAGIGSVHPQVFAQSFTWTRGQGMEATDRDLSVAETDRYLASPVRTIREGAAAIRRRLELPETPVDYPILEELKASGVTDYVAMALPFSDGSRHYIGFNTDRAGGFSNADLAKLYDLLPLITLRLELNTTRHMMTTLLTTYLGAEAASRVQAGTVRRASGDLIDAAILFCDLHNFTRYTDSLPPMETIGLLDLFFDTVAEPINRHGGEVLKILGDGLLCIFPRMELGRNLAACEAATAALEARAALAAIGSDQLPDGIERLWAGFGLHFGQVFFGNIGSRDRLDFTAIGPAVNEAVRVEALCRTLGQDILTTQEFAFLNCQRTLRSLGTHALRGVREPKELFALAS